MTASAESPTVEAITVPAKAAWVAWVDGAVRFAGDRTNPILIKETRQALKSRQFSITFGLLLICGWIWSILGVAIAGQGIWYNAQGGGMFYVYYVILAFPLVVIVPFGAFRSLASEQEDRTYELMSITTLGPRQIIRGKLGSAVLQMLVYLSAISPCLAFTYMLRGIDLVMILYVLAWTILASLGLSIVGLLVGTLTAERHWQVVLSVVLVAGLLLGFIISLWLVGVMLAEGQQAFSEPIFWQINAAVLTGFLGYFVFLFYAAAAAITFSADNRSTRLRVAMLVQHFLFTAWMGWLWASPLEGDAFALILYMIFVGLHWWAMGTLMIGESPELSPRVRRQLPQSFLGRVFLTWFNPGAGTGYMLTLASLAGVLATMLIAVVVAAEWRFAALSQFDQAQAGQVFVFGLVGLSYVTVFLGLGMMLSRFLRRLTYVGVLLSALVQILLVLTGTLVPWIIQLLTPGLRHGGYSLLQITNPVWTLVEIGEGTGLPLNGKVICILVPGAALIVLLLNLPAVAREVRHERVDRPKRIAEEDAALMAVKHPPKPTKTSPWD